MFEPDVVPAPGTAEPLRLQEPRRSRVVIAEDHPVMRDGLIDLLEQEPAVELVGCAISALEVDHLMRVHAPEILVLDLTLGADDGMELAQRLLRERPGLRIIVLSMHDELVYGDRLLSMGVLAYVTKDRTRSEFLLALRSALEGRTYLTVEQRRRRDCRPLPDDLVTPESVLSERELAVLRLLAAGKTASAIAAELCMAPKTVYSHRRNIGAKLGIASGREMLRYAVHWARRAG
jgi:DNA-binding NarL/FixJ family response regulator